MPSKQLLQELAKLSSQFQKRMGLTTFRATLGDADGRVDANNISAPDSYVYVRYTQADGLSQPTVLPFRANMQKTPGAAVIVGYDPDDGRLCVLRPDTNAQLSVGTNPITNNAADELNSYWINQQRIVTLASHPISSAADSMIVTVQPWLRIDMVNGTVAYWQGDKVDLTSYIPAGAGEWAIACVFWKSDNALETFASTPKPSQNDLDVENDILECVLAASDGSQPVWSWQLYNGQTGITPGAISEGGDDFMDLRQIVNAPGSQTGGGGSTFDYGQIAELIWIGLV